MCRTTAALALVGFLSAALHLVPSASAQGADVRGHCEVSIPVSVTNRAGTAAITGLAPESFRVRVHGHELPVSAASLDRGPRRVVFVFDTSGSMVWAEKWSASRQLITALVRAVNTEDEFGWIRFGSVVEETLPTTPHPDQLLNAIRMLPESAKQLDKKSRRTALFDALKAAAGTLPEAGYSDAIILVSDGGDNNSRTSEGEARKLIQNSHARFFVVALVPPESMSYDVASPRNASPNFMNDDDALVTPGILNFYTSQISDSLANHLIPVIDLPKATGGHGWAVDSYFLSRKPEGVLPEIVARVRTLIDDVYRVQIELPGSSGKPERLLVEVLDGRHKVSHDVRVRFPEKVTCQQTPQTSTTSR